MNDNTDILAQFKESMKIFDEIKATTDQFKAAMETLRFSASMMADMAARAAEVREFIKTLGLAPTDERFAHVPFIQLVRDARAYREIRVRYGLAAPAKVKRGPTPRTDEECEEVIDDWVKSGLTQDEFKDFRQWKSRTILTRCLERHRAKHGPNSI